MEVLVLDGKNYVKASKAAKDLGYATDYVGQLCRSGQVDAHLIGRTWYVNQEQLGSHRVEKKRISRVKAREHAKKAIEEHRLKVTETTNNYRNIDIQYEKDDRELIPNTKISQAKKLEIRSESAHARAIAEAEFEEAGNNTIDNAGDKVLMEGDLTVVDVTDGPVDDDTVTLSPKIMRKRHEEAPKSMIVTPQESSEESIGEPVSIKIEKKIPTFTERLGIETVQTEVPKAAVTEVETVVATQAPVPPKSVAPRASLFPYAILTLILLCLSFSTVFFSVTYQYESAESGKISTSYGASFSNTVDIIELIIKRSRLNDI